jgi:hypothetical protein
VRFFLAVILIFSVVFSAEELFFIDRGDTIFLTAQKSARNTDTDDWFITQNGNRVRIAEGIVVELKNESAAKSVFSIPAVKSYEKLSANIFWVIPADKNNQFGLSREFLKNENVINSHPNLIRERKQR